MTEMIERVARALFDVEWASAGSDREFAAMREYWLTAARAAIEAMREPTEAMERAGELKLAWAKYEAVDIWRAMNDEALK